VREPEPEPELPPILLPKIDPSDRMFDALRAIEQAINKLLGLPTEGEHEGDSHDALAERLQAKLRKIQESGAGGDEIILAARALALAIGSFVRDAAQIQREIKGELGPGVYCADPNWTAGLLSSTQAVADATVQMVETVTEPEIDSDSVIGATRMITSSTTRLAAFSRAKGNPESEGKEKMGNSLLAIQDAVARLVNAAKQKEKKRSGEWLTEEELARLKDAPMKEQLRTEFEAQCRIARLEAQLDEQRRYMSKLQKVTKLAIW